jgi:hypothetical protein
MSILCSTNFLETLGISADFQANIFVVPEKVGERKFLCLREVSTNGRRLERVTSAEINLHDICLLRRDKNSGLLSWDFQFFRVGLCGRTTQIIYGSHAPVIVLKTSDCCT